MVGQTSQSPVRLQTASQYFMLRVVVWHHAGFLLMFAAGCWSFFARDAFRAHRRVARMARRRDVIVAVQVEHDFA